MKERDLSRLLSWRRDLEVQRTTECPEEAVIAGYSDGNLSLAERMPLEAHLATCRYCRGQLGILSLLEAESDSPPAVPETVMMAARQLVVDDTTSRPIGNRGWAAGLAAAALAAMLGLAVWLPQGGQVGRSGGSAVRTVVPKQALLMVLQPRESELVPAEEVEIRWTEVSQALSYQLLLVTSDGDIVWKTELEQTQAKLPDNLEMEASSTYFVWIRALLPDGKTLRSTAVGFQVQGGQPSH